MKQHKSHKPLTTTQYSAVKFTGEVLVIVGRVLRSFLFNILVFVLGFGCAYLFLSTKIQLEGDKSTDVMFAQKIEYSIKQQKIFISNLEELLKDYKSKLSRDIMQTAADQP